jgi:hypothetical protein
LLALCRGESTRYPLKGTIWKDSLGAVNLAASQIYRTVTGLHDIGYIDLARTEPGKTGNIPREFYTISKYGMVRLEEEILRLNHAVKIAQYAGVMNNKTPTDIQRLKLDLFDRSEG